MPSFELAPKAVHAMAKELIAESHKPIEEHGVRIDILFAFADVDEKTGNPKGPAMKDRGIKVLGMTKLNGPKERARGLGDVLIVLDGDWWEKAQEPERRALLDHELQHIAPSEDRDKQGRPRIVLRLHDVEVGWFQAIAERHGIHSQERIQAQKVLDRHGQYFWPELLGHADTRTGRTAKLELHS